MTWEEPPSAIFKLLPSCMHRRGQELASVSSYPRGTYTHGGIIGEHVKLVAARRTCRGTHGGKNSFFCEDTAEWWVWHNCCF
ncbi:unnamed protein product [Discosporangium mesarthrocarpum]